MGYNYNGELEYKIINGKGIIKEYNNIGKLIFEGEYINGEKTGKGIEYNQEEDNFKFEGEYKKGQKNEKGKEYINNKLIFECEYLNGKKWNEKGKEYLIMNNPIANKFEKILVFEGEYSNGKAINGISYDYIKNKEYKLIQGK